MGDMNAAASPSPKAPPQHVDLTTDLTTPDGKDGGFDDVEMAQALKASLAENPAAAAGSSSKPSPASAARPAGAGPLSVQSLVDAFKQRAPRVALRGAPRAATATATATARRRAAPTRG